MALRIRHIFHGVALLVGIVAFAVLVEKLGWNTMVDTVRHTGAWFAVIAVIDFASVMSDAGGVYNFLPRDVRPHYLRVFAAQASGLAINRLTPGNSLGEPVKVAMLMEHVPEAPAVSAIVMFNLSTIYVAIAAIVLGVPITILLADLPGRIQLVVWIATGILVLFAVGLTVLISRGAFGTLVGALARVRIISRARADRWSTRVAAIDGNVRQLGRPGSRRGLIFVVLSRCLNWAGTLAIMFAADIELVPSLVVAVLSVGILITWASNVIPLGMGIADGSNYALYGALGPSGTQGLAFTLINRLRTVVLALLGLSVMAIAAMAERSRRRRSPPTPAPPPAV